jgi:phosphopantetheinyl transferase
MILNHSRKILNHSSNVLDERPAGKRVSIHFGQFESNRQSRKERRQCQSRAARQLLNDSLHQISDAGLVSSWRLEKSDSGKPFLDGAEAPEISLAHSKNWVACAISNISKIGVDIETIRSHHWDAYCDNFFHEEEARWIQDGSIQEQDVRGLTCWCRKEALVKALGTGMTVPPASIVFSPEGRLIALPTGLGSISDWASHTQILQNQAVIAAVWKN